VSGVDYRGSMVALITGASSGLGAAFARRLASQGYDLILVARRRQRLTSLADELHEQFGVNVEVLVADLADTIDVGKVESRIAELAPLDLLVNNADFGIPAKFAETQLDRHLAMIHVHVLASVRFSRAALPGMLARGRGAMINVSSIGAFMPKPGDVTYCATKAYLNTFSEALQAEVGGTGVRIQALCPGFTHTEFLDNPEYEKYQIKTRIPEVLWMSAEEVVEKSLDALGQGRVVCVPGLRNWLIVILARAGLTNLLLKVLGGRVQLDGG
jgi:short-subunit dehydrogenase